MDGKDTLYVRSTKKKNKTGFESSSLVDDDVWDDSVLVEAYNKAVEHAHIKVQKTYANFPLRPNISVVRLGQRKSWNVGDFCKCEYSEDHASYEAQIIDIIDELDMCVVKFVGYDNEEKVPLKKLRPSGGEISRATQKRLALKDKGLLGGQSFDKQPGPGIPPQEWKKDIPKKPENAKGCETAPGDNINPQPPPASQMFKPILTDAIPPPPPPQIFGKKDDENIPESDAMSAMLMSWYMSGYHTGYYQGLKAAKK